MMYVKLPGELGRLQDMQIRHLHMGILIISGNGLLKLL